MNQSILFLLRRLGFYLMAAFAALTLNFFIPRLMPGDPATIIFARFRGKLKPEAIDALRETFGLNDASLIDQYFSYLKSILSGDLGISIAYFPQEVSFEQTFLFFSLLQTNLSWNRALDILAFLLEYPDLHPKHP